MVVKQSLLFPYIIVQLLIPPTCSLTISNLFSKCWPSFHPSRTRNEFPFTTLTRKSSFNVLLLLLEISFEIFLPFAYLGKFKTIFPSIMLIVIMQQTAPLKISPTLLLTLVFKISSWLDTYQIDKTGECSIN